MTWIKFTIWLISIYTSYYAAIILWDQFISKRGETRKDEHELTFIEDIETVKSHFEDSSPDFNEPSVVSSGGVSLKEMFNLAREEVIEYTRAVSF